MKGWRFESHRHQLAAKGIKTRYFARTPAQINVDLIVNKEREQPLLKGGVGDWLRTRAEDAKYTQELAQTEGKDLFPSTRGLFAEYRRQWGAEDAAKAASDVRAIERAKVQPVVEKGDVAILPKPEEVDLLEQDRRNEEIRALNAERTFDKVDAEMKQSRKEVGKGLPFFGTGK